MSGSIPSKARLLGGAGKYNGLTGNLSFTLETWSPISKTETMVADNYKGDYKIGE